MAKKIIYTCDKCGKDINPDTDIRVFYKTRHYHQSCLIDKLKSSKRPKYSSEEINEIIERYTPKRQKALMKKEPTRKRSRVKVQKVSLPKNKLRENLLKKIGIKYSLPFREDATVGTIIDSINNGTYKKLNGEKIPYEKLEKMFDYYEQYLYKSHNYVKGELKPRSCNFFI